MRLIFGTKQDPFSGCLSFSLALSSLSIHFCRYDLVNVFELLKEKKEKQKVGKFFWDSLPHHSFSLTLEPWLKGRPPPCCSGFILGNLPLILVICP